MLYVSNDLLDLFECKSDEQFEKSIVNNVERHKLSIKTKRNEKRKLRYKVIVSFSLVTGET